MNFDAFKWDPRNSRAWPWRLESWLRCDLVFKLVAGIRAQTDNNLPTFLQERSWSDSIPEMQRQVYFSFLRERPKGAFL